MEQTIFVAGGDHRQKAIVDKLEREGRLVFSFGLRAEDQLTPEIAAQLCAADIVLLPLPAADENGYLNAPFMNKKIPLELLWPLLRAEQKIFGGMLSDLVLRSASEYRVQPIDYYMREEFVIRNAYITAECAVQRTMEELQHTIRGTKCLVLGYGRIGKCLAKMLRNMGSETTVAARKGCDRVWAELDGHQTCTFEHLCEKDTYDIIYNTVPHLVLDRKSLERAGKNCLCIDLASRPGGIDFGAADSLGIKTIWALGLPGKMAPHSAGIAILDTVFQILEEEEVPV